MGKKTKPQNVIAMYFYEMTSAKHNPRFKIIVTNGLLELFVNTLIELKCKNSKKILDRTDFTYSIKLILLHEKGLITDSLFQYIEAFRNLRNKAAHGSQFHLTAAMLNPFKNMTAHLENFNLICYNLVFRLHQENSKLFNNYFGSSLFDLSPILGPECDDDLRDKIMQKAQLLKHGLNEKD